MESTTPRPAAVIGPGSFGLAVSKLLAINVPVYLLCRTDEVAQRINSEHAFRGVSLPQRVIATSSVEQVTEHCRTIFPVVPSGSFRSMMQWISPHLKPAHFIIHCTKGLDVSPGVKNNSPGLSRSRIRTMSEVISEESLVLRIGCLSGPNLAKEILEGQPTATVVASEYVEVITEGQELLSSKQFFVFGSHDIIGAEIAGALKNIFAIGSGYLAGKGLGKNIQSMLLTRGLHEIVYFGRAMGSNTKAFMGTAGIGDLIATATSLDSRNYSFGLKLGQGKSVDDILAESKETVEGLRTLKIAMRLAEHYDIKVPVTTMLYKIVYEQFPFTDALQFLMRYPYAVDVDFI